MISHQTVGQELWVARCGTLEYSEGVALQRTLRDARIAGTVPDMLLLLEHPAVYTRGRRADSSELPFGEQWYAERGIAIEDTDRGGKTTYHGPGQLVGYPIIDLASVEKSVPALVDTLEETLVEALAAEGVEATGDRRLRGVWTGGRKIAQIGLHVARGVTMHGFSVNVDCDLEPFTWIKPCGLDIEVTSLAQETGDDTRMECFSKRVAYGLATQLGLRQRLISPPRLQSILDGKLAFAS
ncbi:MAG: lipoyl(octanoyl) transferase LipB [Thermoleophilaceae bacterium]|nr:lipoyl(octanoyl) transferase LipB [Thermoleophilaceae bacterium]